MTICRNPPPVVVDTVVAAAGVAHWQASQSSPARAAASEHAAGATVAFSMFEAPSVRR